MQCIAAVSVLGIIVIGLLVMVRVITVEQALHAIGRVFACIVLFLIALCLLQTVVVPWLSSLLPLLIWLAAIAFVVIVVLLVTKFVATRGMNRDRKSRTRGEP